MDLKSTLNLPDPEFTIPMKADLSRREPEIQARWDDQAIYHAIQERRRAAPPFVLHDGPPYANSPIHIGTALNKVLKDLVVKAHSMMGYRCPYVPGFDTHGLPIEQAVLARFKDAGVEPDVSEFRQACRDHVRQYIDTQTRQFKRLGVFGLWEAPYITMDFGFEAEIVRVFKRMVELGFVYRGLRPTLWSPTSQTALADTEITYQEHTSVAIYVRFKLLEDPNRLFDDYPGLYTIIWTTTPWTIPANLAVAFHPELQYAVVRAGGEHYLVLQALVPKLAGILGWQEYQTLMVLDGINLDGAKFKHPIFDRESLAVTASYVTTEEGTGVVHTAPGHGRDDFATGQRYGLPILCPVDERGVLTTEAGEFAGVSYRDCDKVVVERLRQTGALLRADPYVHSYPHSERDGQPVIFRATEQWFVSIDHADLRERMLERIEGVRWVPSQGQRRIEAMVANRPDWCISRQRPWGVGIPIFYGRQSGKPVMDPVAIEAVARLVEEGGSDAWFLEEPRNILPPSYEHPDTGERAFVKETNVLDVWFDSGSTSFCVLEGNVNSAWQEAWPADVYLEGSDQHRGWFNSSLVIGTALRDQAPYRAVVTHGFVVDEQGRKMSKRLGNVIDPVQVCETYGADILRYWVASVDYAFDVSCSEAILKQVADGYRQVRNSLRFLLGNLYDFDGSGSPSLDLDLWIVEQADLLAADCIQAYRDFDFNRALSGILLFCKDQLSSFYLDVIKDRMYCDGKDWPTRRSGQAACLDVLRKLTKLIAPILPHTAEEVYDRLPGEKLASVHLEVFGEPTEGRLEQIRGGELERRVAALLAARGLIFAEFERWKGESGVKDSQDAVLIYSDDAAEIELLRSFGEDLPTLLKFSWVELEVAAPGARFRQSEYLRCERSRVRRPDVSLVNGTPLSARDRKVLGV